MHQSGSIRMTRHATERQLKRGIPDEQLHLAIDFGRRVHGSGVEVYFLGRKDIPPWIDHRMAWKIEGTVVVMSPEDDVITTYRNPRCIAKLRRQAELPRPRYGAKCEPLPRGASSRMR